MRRHALRIARAVEGPIKELCAWHFGRTFKRNFAWPAESPGVSPVAPSAARPETMAILCEEFFDRDLGGYGGFGFTARALAAHYGDGSPLRAALVVPRDVGRAKRPTLETIAGTPRLLLPGLPRLVRHAHLAQASLRTLRPAFFLSIDYLTKYEYALWIGPDVPLLVYLRDPRGPAEWRKIATVTGAIAREGRPAGFDPQDIATQRRESFQRVLLASRRTGRPIAFATNGRFLIDPARRTLGLPEDAVVHDLPNPVALPGDAPPPPRGGRPLLLLLGRVEPVKRPWIFCELARRFPALDFVVAGPVQDREIVDPLLARYAVLKNLRFVGLVMGEEKERLFRACSFVVNTSVHEGLPVSFLEAFARGRCVLSSRDPEGLVSRFGRTVGEWLGDGRDAGCLQAFADGIEACLADPDRLAERGAAAREYVGREHTFARFDGALRALLAVEGWLAFGDAQR